MAVWVPQGLTQTRPPAGLRSIKVWASLPLRFAMEPGSFVALHSALEHELPSVVEQLLLSLERERMAKEDAVAHALDGRGIVNCALDPKYRSRQSWRHYAWEEIERAFDLRERARLARQRVEMVWVEMGRQDPVGRRYGPVDDMNQLHRLLTPRSDVDLSAFSDRADDMEED